MGRLQGGGFAIETIGDAIDAGSSVSAYCLRGDCGRELELDVYDLAIAFGRSRRTIGRRLPLKCSGCGGTEIQLMHRSDHRPRHSAVRDGPTNFRGSRSDEERRALAVVFPWDPR